MAGRLGASIRLAGTGDRDAVRDLLQEVRAAFGEPPAGDSLERLLDDSLDGGPLEFFVARADEDDLVVGLVSMACTATSQSTGLFAWLDDLDVRPSHRRRGIGSQLVAAALRRATERGADEVRLAAAMGDAGIVALYRRAGFTSRGQALMTLPLDGPSPGGER